MLTNTERQQIVEEVNAGTYGIDEALDDIAAAQKGEEVRKALYAEALVLNREGHAGSTDMIARQKIANLQTSVNGQISTLRTEVGEDIDDLETALNSGLATQNGKIAAQDATIANVVANYNVEYGSTELWASTGETGALAAGTTVTLSEDVSHFDYIDIYSFCGNSNVLDTVPVDAKLQSSQGYALRWVNLSDPDSGSYKAYVRIIETRLHIIGTTLTIDHQVTYRNGEEVNISGAEITQANRSTYIGELGIMKIVGRKITANTEIEDVRIGADGTEYASAGQAVRAQVTALESAIPAVDSTLSTQGAAADAKIVGDEFTNVKEDLNNIKDTLTYEKQLLINASSLAGNNNTAITNNNDGTYTVGTTDYGITTFGSGAPINLEPGDYYLYGVPNGMSFLSTTYTASTAYKNKIFENQNAYPEIFHTDAPISVYVGFRSPSAPAEAYTISPNLYMIAAENKELYKPEAISLNGNYFEDIDSAWTDGWYRTAIGIIDSSDTLQYAFCPIVGAGTYTEVIQYAVWGSSTNVIALADEKYSFAKSITGVRDGNNVTFSITDDDIVQCKYVVMRRDKSKAFSPKLFYNATASGGIYPLNPVYGYKSDKLYKKTIVCDGDSIGFGYRDEPKQHGSWFGRLQNDYQVSGHNYSVSGATITDMRPSVSHSVALNIDVIYNDYPTLDYLILEGGTNDSDRIGNFVGDTPPEGFGTWSDESASDYNGGYDVTTFCGAVDEMFYKAVTYYPNAKIGFIIPMQMGTYTTSSKRRRRYFDEIVKIANKWHVNVLDLWNICHADARISAYYSGTEGDLTKFYYDGQHPTSVGYDLMQPTIEAWLKTL